MGPLRNRRIQAHGHLLHLSLHKPADGKGSSKLSIGLYSFRTYSYLWCLLCLSVALNLHLYFRQSDYGSAWFSHRPSPNELDFINPQCSGSGLYGQNQGINGEEINGSRTCNCYHCFTGSDCSLIVPNCVINFDHGDPKMFQEYWSRVQDASTTMIWAGQKMSYFSNTKNLCWFLEPALESEIRALHTLVGNVPPQNHYIIVGTGSSQLIHAVLYALSLSVQEKPVDVISAVPYHSSYPPMTDFLQSGLHRWAGDAFHYVQSNGSTYIELVTSPGNPDGLLHDAVANGKGVVVHDLAYYWPQFTPIVSTLDHDIMLFTISKSTGHAGTRLGWALVRDMDVAKKMTKYIELNTIGVSKDSQLRASQIIRSIRNGYLGHKSGDLWDDLSMGGIGRAVAQHKFFHFGYKQMESRWKKLQDVVKKSACFSLEKFPPAQCTFFGKETSPQPAFAWLRCEKHDDCHTVLADHGIIARSGIHFGAETRYVRISMVDYEANFDLFVDRMRAITCEL